MKKGPKKRQNKTKQRKKKRDKRRENTQSMSLCAATWRFETGKKTRTKKQKNATRTGNLHSKNNFFLSARRRRCVHLIVPLFPAPRDGQ